MTRNPSPTPPDYLLQSNEDETQKHPLEAAEKEEHNIDCWTEPDFDEEPPDDISIHDEPAPWKGKWKETKYDSFEDARQNVSHVGDSKQDYEHIHESDDHTAMSGESVRRRGTDEWSVPESLY
jgi:hypothetical protein